jgi:hypothetical protein
MLCSVVKTMVMKLSGVVVGTLDLFELSTAISEASRLYMHIDKFAARLNFGAQLDFY